MQRKRFQPESLVKPRTLCANQDDVLNKLSEYLSKTSKDKDALALSDALSKEEYCYNFALCRGAMAAVGRAEGWEYELRAVADWDGDPKKLTTHGVLLPDSETKTPLMLDEVFRRVLDFIVGYIEVGQAPQSVKPFLIAGTSQRNILSPQPVEAKAGYKRFEMLHKGKILTVQQHARIAGNFTHQQLFDLLDEKQMAGNICLVHAPNHTVQFGYENGKYVIYNPGSESETSVHEEFDSKEEALEYLLEILKIPGNELEGEVACAIEMASFNPRAPKFRFPSHEKAIKENPLQLLKGFGLTMLALSSPWDLPTVIDNALQANDSRLADVVCSALQQTCESDGWNGLQVVAVYAPEQLGRLFAIAEQSKHATDMLRSALIHKNEHGRSGMYLVERNAPGCLPQAKKFLTDEYLHKNMFSSVAVLECVAELKGGVDKVANGLVSGNANLGILTAASNGTLGVAIKYVQDSTTWHDSAAALLTTKEPRFGMSGFQRLLNQAKLNKTEPLIQVMNAAARSKNGASQILLALSSMDKDQISGRNVLKTLPGNVQELVKKAFVSSLTLLGRDELLALSGKLKLSGSAASEFHGLRKKSPGFFHNFFRSYAENTLTTFLSKEVEAEIAKRKEAKLEFKG